MLEKDWLLILLIKNRLKKKTYRNIHNLETIRIEYQDQGLHRKLKEG